MNNTEKMRQRKLDLNSLRDDILKYYKQDIQTLYRKYRNISSDQIRVEYMRVITDHISKRTIERLQRKTRKGKTKIVYINAPQEAKEQSW